MHDSIKARLSPILRLRILCLILSTLAGSGCTVLEPQVYPRNSGNIILTFDDGPSANGSPALLDVLAAHEVPATFCYIGKGVAENPEIAARALAEGHAIANHSYFHELETLADANHLADEVEQFNALIADISDGAYAVERFRPPLGIITPGVAEVIEAHGLGYAYVTFFINDAWTGPDGAEAFIAELKGKLLEHGGGAIVIHEKRHPLDPDAEEVDKSWVPGAVDELIGWAKAEGFTFVHYPDYEPGELPPSVDPEDYGMRARHQRRPGIAGF
ncbi:MAG: polysaccharide deacetylase family protein [Opitutales bacterium]